MRVLMQYLYWEVALNWKKKIARKGNRIRIGILKLDLPEYVPVGAETVARRFGILWDVHISHFYGTVHWKIWKYEGEYAQQKCHAAGFLLRMSTYVRLTPDINLSLILRTKLPSFTQSKPTRSYIRQFVFSVPDYTYKFFSHAVSFLQNLH